MRYLALRKVVIAEQIGSRALRADAMEAVTCGWLSLVVVVSFAAQWLVGTWWIDATKRATKRRRCVLNSSVISMWYGGIGGILSAAPLPEVHFILASAQCAGVAIAAIGESSSACWPAAGWARA
jgi:hypothetical protein